MKPKTSFLEKLSLVSLGILCCVFLIEISLRFAGLAFYSLQQYRNHLSIKQKGAYRILCLGESTTANQYPRFLEEVLNQRNIGIRFSVIDKGIGGTNTFYIADGLESNLNAYHPDMVITMMGINDYGPHMPYEAGSDSKAISFLKSFKIYKLTRLLWLHIVTRLNELKSDKPSKYSAQPRFLLQKGESKQVYAENKAIELNPKSDNAYVELGQLYRDQGKFSEAEESFKKAIELNPKNDWAYVELGSFYRNQEKFSEAEALLKKAIELNPKNDNAYVELGWFYRDQGRFSEAEPFKKAIELNPKNDGAYVGLGWVYRDQGKFSEAEEPFKKAIELNPKNDRAIAYFGLGWVYQDQGKFSEAEASFKKTIELNPKNDWAYVGLGWVYRNQGRLSETEASFKKAIEANPKKDGAYFELGWFYQGQGRLSEAEASFKKAIEANPKKYEAYFELGRFYQDQGRLSEAEASFKKAIELKPKKDRSYVGLGWVYRDQGKFSEAEASFKKAIELNPKNDRAYGALEVLYAEMDNSSLARKYDTKDKESGLNYYPLMTTGNYHKLKAILDKRGIVYVCVQYPMRNLEPLRRIFQGNTEGIIFVDNERIFRDALKQRSYRDYFKDMFGGDFGHCTDKGNRLLAENIANVILKEVFGK